MRETNNLHVVGTMTIPSPATIKAELRALRRADRDTQKTIRNRLRKRGFYITDYTSSSEGFTEGDFDALVRRGTIRIE